MAICINAHHAFAVHLPHPRTYTSDGLLKRLRRTTHSLCACRNPATICWSRLRRISALTLKEGDRTALQLHGLILVIRGLFFHVVGARPLWKNTRLPYDNGVRPFTGPHNLIPN
jgi:hypothetical protein